MRRLLCLQATAISWPPNKKSSSSRYNSARGTDDTTIYRSCRYIHIRLSCNRPASGPAWCKHLPRQAQRSVTARLTNKKRKSRKASMCTTYLVPMFPANMLFHPKMLRLTKFFTIVSSYTYKSDNFEFNVFALLMKLKLQYVQDMCVLLLFLPRLIDDPIIVIVINTICNDNYRIECTLLRGTRKWGKISHFSFSLLLSFADCVNGEIKKIARANSAYGLSEIFSYLLYNITILLLFFSKKKSENYEFHFFLIFSRDCTWSKFSFSSCFSLSLASSSHRRARSSSTDTSLLCVW